ncbi:hypothetical protein [Methylobacterium ajmalii]|uniref:gp53-like domain-containing protein n=1 Tax=Methylobacterium ajmalii TaxID=2738439 RepID=UPI002F356C14
MPSRYELPPELDISADEELTKDRLDRAWKYVVDRLLIIDSFRPSWEEQLDLLRSTGLARLDQALKPVYDGLVEVTQLGILFTADSTTPTTIGTGLKAFTVSKADRDRFAAAAYLSAQDTATPENTMFGRLQSYDRTAGVVTILVDQFAGEEGASSSTWRISAAASPNILATAHQVGAYTMGEVDTLISALNAAVAAKANRASPQLTGTPTAPTVGRADASGDQIATLGFVQLVAATLDGALRAGSPDNLNTIGKLAQALGGDSSFATTIGNALSNRLRLDAGQTFNDSQKAQGRANLNAQQNLGFTPVRQGGGANQNNNAILIGWGTDGNLRCQVDAYDLGKIWTDQGTGMMWGGRGYIRLPNGLMIQWGGSEVTLDGNGNARIDWPSWFPNEYYAMSIVNSNGNQNYAAPVTFGHNTREFYVQFPGRPSAQGTFSYIAVGR